jgi:hypothetical protein
MEVLKVSAKSSPNSVAGALAGVTNPPTGKKGSLPVPGWCRQAFYFSLITSGNKIPLAFDLKLIHFLLLILPHRYFQPNFPALLPAELFRLRQAYIDPIVGIIKDCTGRKFFKNTIRL